MITSGNLWRISELSRRVCLYLFSEIEHRFPATHSDGRLSSSVSHKLTRLVNQIFLQQQSNSFFRVIFPTSDINANYMPSIYACGVSSKCLTFDTQYRYSKSIDQLSNEALRRHRPR